MSKIRQQDSSKDTMLSPLLEQEEMDLLSDEAPLTFLQAVMPSVELLLFLLKRGINPNTLFGILYLILLLGIGNYFVANILLCQICLVTFLVLPTVLMAFAVFFIAHVFVSKRQPAFDSAHALLWERVQQGRAIRKEGSYDVYLPVSFEDATSEEKKDEAEMERSTSSKHGIIFFPGALINHTAYAALAAKLSDHGIVVVVMSYGSSRLSMDVAACQERAQLAMLEMTYEFAAYNLPSVDQWTLAGHSLGGTLALNAAANMESIEKVILCGVGRDAMGVSSTFSSSNKQVLVLNGSNDPFVTECTQDQKQNFRDCLPPAKTDNDEDSSLEKTTSGMTKYVTIQGGNHAGFAHYGPQTYPKRDGKRTISLDEQQELFVQNTLELLLNMSN